MTAVQLAAPRPTANTDPVRPATKPFEPFGEPEMSKPFSPGIGTWLGVGGAGLLGGIIGMAGGGLLGLAAAPDGGPLGIAVFGAMTVGGAALGGWLAYNGFKGAHESS